jgi:hypothetical protein
MVGITAIQPDQCSSADVRILQKTKATAGWCRFCSGSAALRELNPTEFSERVMMSDFDVVRAADAMMHQFGEHAEFQAARYADLMLGHSNRAGLLLWARIWRTIAEKHPAPNGLPH